MNSIDMVQSLMAGQFTSQLPGYVFSKIPGSIYAFANKMMANELLGYRNHNDAVGVSEYDIPSIVSEYAHLFAYEDEEVIRTGKPLSNICAIPFPAGTKLFLGQKFPLKDPDENIIAMAGVTHVIEEKALINLSLVLSSMDEKYRDDVDKLRFSYILGNYISPVSLSKRQSECLFYLLRGKTAKEMAKILGVGHRTIESHQNRLKWKFGCETQGQLIEKCVNLGMINTIPQPVVDRLRGS